MHEPFKWVSQGSPTWTIAAALFALASPQLCGRAAMAEPVISVTVGTPDFPDLGAAIAAIPRLRRSGRDVEILLPAGVYRLKAPVVIDAAHGGGDGSQLIIRGAGMGRTRLLGSVILQSRPAVPDDTGGRPFPSGALSIDLSTVLSSVNLVRRGAYVPSAPALLALFQGSERLQPARWPANGWAQATASGPREALQLTLLGKSSVAWEHEPALWAAGYWSTDWAYERLPVFSAETGRLTLAALQTPLPARRHVRFRIENALSEVRQPGDFAVDPIRRIVVFIPRNRKQAVEATVASSLLRIEGAKNVTISGIAFDRTLRAAVMVINAHDIRFVGCAFRQTGATGVSVSGGRRVQIENSVVADTAERGVLLSGGDRPTLTASEHVFADGVIADFGQESPSYRPAVELWGVGNAVRNSLLTGGDHNAVMLSGNDHEVTGNEISDVLRDTEDAGAVYMGADWAARGMVIARNTIRLGRRTTDHFLSGIYLDDQASGARVELNRIEGGDYGVIIGGGRDNLIRNNVIVTPLRGGIFFDARGLTTQRKQTSELAIKLSALPVRGLEWRMRYPSLASLEPYDFGRPEGNRLSENVVIGAQKVVGDADIIADFLTVEPNQPDSVQQSAPALPSTTVAKLLAFRRPPATD